MTCKHDFLVTPWGALYIVVAFLFFHQNLLFLNLISVLPDLRRRKKFWKREGKENLIFHLASYPRTKKSVLFSILTVWLRNKENQKLKSPETSHWNNASAAKKDDNNSQCEKKSESGNLMQLSHTNTEKIFHL